MTKASDQDREHRRPCGDNASDAIAVEHGADRHHDPQPDKQAIADSPTWRRRRGRSRRRARSSRSRAEGEQGHDAAVEGVGGNLASGVFCRGQNSAAAMNSDGSRKKIWLAAKIAGCRMWSNQPRTGAARCSA